MRQLLLILMLAGVARATNIFVDTALSVDCDGNYSIANRNCTGTDGDAYVLAQSAANVADTGDTVWFRAGKHKNTSTGSSTPVMRITLDGSVSNPVVYKNYNGETVVISGENATGGAYKQTALAIGSRPSDTQDSSGYGVTNIIIEGIAVTRSTYYSLGIYGQANRISANTDPSKNIKIRYCKAYLDSGASAIGAGIKSIGRVENLLIEYCECWANYGPGVGFGRVSKEWHAPESDSLMSGAYKSKIQNCLVYRSIHPISPGNTDGMDAANAYACTLSNNITYDNSDDGMDVYSSCQMVIEHNIIFHHDYVGGNNSGFKFSAGGGGKHTVRNNISFDNLSYSYECSSPTNPQRTYYPSRIYNNVAYNCGDGFNFGTTFSTGDGWTKLVLKNNFALDNAGEDFNGSYDSSKLESDYNYIGNTSNYNGLQAEGLDLNSLTGSIDIPTGSVTIDTVLSPAWTIETKLAYIRNQVSALFTPIAGSDLIDAGTDIYDIDFNGAAPDIGAYETGVYTWPIQHGYFNVDTSFVNMAICTTKTAKVSLWLTDTATVGWIEYDSVIASINTKVILVSKTTGRRRIRFKKVR